jgi:hypothetical protein
MMHRLYYLVRLLRSSTSHDPIFLYNVIIIIWMYISPLRWWLYCILCDRFDTLTGVVNTLLLSTLTRNNYSAMGITDVFHFVFQRNQCLFCSSEEVYSGHVTTWFIIDGIDHVSRLAHNTGSISHCMCMGCIVIMGCWLWTTRVN